MSKNFFVVYPLEKGLRNYLDIMRFIANPMEKHPAHITVRGPYKRTPSMASFSNIVAGSYINVQGVGCFFDHNQNTVFLKCQSETLRGIWRKPEYRKEFNPHITIYNGFCPDFARRLLDCLQMVNIDFSFQVGNLSLLTSKRNQFPSMGMLNFFNEEVFYGIMKKQMPVSTLFDLSPIEKIYIIGRVARRMNEFALSPKTLQLMFPNERRA